MLSYLTISGATRHTAMVVVFQSFGVPVCLHSCRYKEPTLFTYRLLETGILSLQASLKSLTVGSASPQSHLVGCLPLLK